MFTTKRLMGTAMALAMCVLSGVGVADAAAATGDLVQKPGAAGCLSMIGFCERGAALDGAESMHVSPDGTSAYVASDYSDAVAVFDRAGDGTLIQKPGPAGCISDTGAGRCRDGTALDGARSVAVSPDGRSVYVASAQRRGGGVRPHPGRQAGPEAGHSGLHLGHRRRPLRRRHGPRLCPVGGGQPRRDERLRRDPSRPTRVAVFDRAEDGTLTQKPGTAGCISETGAGPCVDGRALEYVSSVVVSPDGQSVYVASRQQRRGRGGSVRPRRRRDADPEAGHRGLHLGETGTAAAATGRPSPLPARWRSAPTGGAPTSRRGSARWQRSTALATAA